MNNADQTVPIRDAATVVLVRESETGPRVLMGQRGSRAVFMPNKFVFPGGAVDPEDHTRDLAYQIPEEARRLLSWESHSCSVEGLINAALRELVEETGLTLKLDADPGRGVFDFFFRAITPPGRPRRFDARFFLANADNISNDPDDFSQASDELSNLAWVELDYARRLELPFITEVVLAEVEARIKAPQTNHTVPFFCHDENGGSFRKIDLDSA